MNRLLARRHLAGVTMAAIAVAGVAGPVFGATPDTTITAGPSGPWPSRKATFSFASSIAGSTFTCRLDDGRWLACSSPRSYTKLGQGQHTFSVRARMGTQVDTTPAVRRWKVDTVPPDTTITGGRSGTTLDIAPEWTFTSSERRSTFTCTIDGPPWNGQSVDCSSPWRATSLYYRTPYTVAVRATDAAGNVDPTPATRGFSIEPINLGGGPYAQAAAERYFPDSIDLDVPVVCGAGGTDCPGGTPLDPSKQLRVQTGGLDLVAYANQNRWDVTATIGVTSLASFSAQVPLVGDCPVTLDSSLGSKPTWTVSLSLSFRYDDQTGDVRITWDNMSVTGIDNEDRTVTGNIGCQLTGIPTSIVVNAVVATLDAYWVRVGSPLCEKPAPRLVGRCPG